MNAPKTFDPETGGCFSLKKKKKKIINTLKHASFFSVALCDKVNKQRSGGCILALSTLKCQHSTWLCGGFADGSFLKSLMGHMQNTLGLSGRLAAIRKAGGPTKGRFGTTSWSRPWLKRCESFSFGCRKTLNSMEETVQVMSWPCSDCRPESDVIETGRLFCSVNGHNSR